MYTNTRSLYADLTSQNRSNQDGTIFLLREADASYTCFNAFLLLLLLLLLFFVVVAVTLLFFSLSFFFFFSFSLIFFLPVQCCFTSPDTVWTIRVVRVVFREVLVGTKRSQEVGKESLELSSEKCWWEPRDPKRWEKSR